MQTVPSTSTSFWESLRWRIPDRIEPAIPRAPLTDTSAATTSDGTPEKARATSASETETQPPL